MANKIPERVFAFGCSLTDYGWPTWADFVGRHWVSTAGAEFHNYGLAGAGNNYIFHSMIKADAQYQFTDKDLIMVCWSSWNREDRFLSHPDVVHSVPGWTNQGNVLVGEQYDENFLDRYWSLENDIINNISSILAVRKLFHLDWEMHIAPIEHADRLTQCSPQTLKMLLDWQDQHTYWAVKSKEEWPRNSLEYKLRRFDGHPPPTEHFQKAQHIVRSLSGTELHTDCEQLLKNINLSWLTALKDVHIHDQWWESQADNFNNWAPGTSEWRKNHVHLWGIGAGEEHGYKTIRQYLDRFLKGGPD